MAISCRSVQFRLADILDGKGGVEVEQHVGTCASCASKLSELRKLRESLLGVWSAPDATIKRATDLHPGRPAIRAVPVLRPAGSRGGASVKEFEAAGRTIRLTEEARDSSKRVDGTMGSAGIVGWSSGTAPTTPEGRFSVEVPAGEPSLDLFVDGEWIEVPLGRG